MSLPENVLSLVRWVLLAAALMNVLQATVLFNWMQRTVIGRWAAFAERAGRPLPAFILDSRVQRGWLIFNAVVFFALWWFLGTPAGVRWLES